MNGWIHSAPLLGVMLLLPSAAARSQDAPMFRGDAAHSGVYPGPGLAAFTAVKWRFRTGGRILSSPAVVAGIAYVGSADGSMYAVDMSSGAKKWSFKTDARITSSPAVVDGHVYFGSYDGVFYSVDAGTGALQWKFSTGGERRFAAPHLHGALPMAELMPDPFDVYLSSPAVLNGVVYFGSGDNYVYALDGGTGALKWKFATGNVVHASPAIANNTVFIGSWDTYFYALDASDGTVKWRFKTGEDADIHNQTGITSSAAVVDGVVYFGCRDAHVYALDANTGTQRWAFATKKGSWVTGSPAVHDGTVYVGDGSSKEFHALDARTGLEKFAIPTTNGVFSSAAFAGRLVYFGVTNGRLHAVDPTTGKLAWTFTTDSALARPHARERISKLLTGPGAMEGGFYDAMVIGFSMFNGMGIFASPVIVGRVMLVGSGDGTLYALR